MKAAAKPEPPMKCQLTIFDIMAAEDAKETAPESERPEPETGAWIYDHGAVIPHIMRPGFIGRKVAYTCGTQSQPNLFRVGILEKYFYNEHAKCWRSMPDAMFRYRAAALFARTECPEVLQGVRDEYEQQDINGYESEQKQKTKVVLDDVYIEATVE